MAQQRELTIYLNGESMSHSQGVAAMKGMGFESSGGLYDGERTFNGQVFRLRQHLERLYRGLKHAGLDPGLSLDEMESATLGVLEKNIPLLEPGDEYSVRQVVSLDSTGLSEGKRRVNVVIHCQHLDFTEFAWGCQWDQNRDSIDIRRA